MTTQEQVNEIIKLAKYFWSQGTDEHYGAAWNLLAMGVKIFPEHKKDFDIVEEKMTNWRQYNVKHAFRVFDESEYADKA